MKLQIKATKRHRGAVAATGLGTGLTAALMLVFSGSAAAACVDAVTVQNHDTNPALSAAASVSGSDTRYLAQTGTSGTSTPPQDGDQQHQQDQQHMQDQDQQHMQDQLDQQHMQNQQHQPGQDDEEQHQQQQPAPTQ